MIGGPGIEKPVVAVLEDTRQNYKLRAAAAEALNLLGEMGALPSLLKVADEKFIAGTTIDGEHGSAVTTAATAYSRLADAEHANVTFQKLPADLAETDAGAAFRAATARLQVAKDCKKDIACYAKVLAGPDANKADKAAFMLARLGKPAASELAKAVGHPEPLVRFAV